MPMMNKERRERWPNERKAALMIWIFSAVAIGYVLLGYVVSTVLPALPGIGPGTVSTALPMSKSVSIEPGRASQPAVEIRGLPEMFGRWCLTMYCTALHLIRLPM